MRFFNILIVSFLIHFSCLTAAFSGRPSELQPAQHLSLIQASDISFVYSTNFPFKSIPLLYDHIGPANFDHNSGSKRINFSASYEIELSARSYFYSSSNNRCNYTGWKILPYNFLCKIQI